MKMYFRSIRARCRPVLSVALLLSGLLFSGLLPCSPAAHAERIQDLPKPSNYVNDFAGVLSEETQQQLNEYCSEIDHQAHAQIAVVTVKTLDGDEADNYAVKLEEAWKVGPKGSDRGVLILLAVNDHKDRIEVGYGLEGILPDGKTGDMLRGIVPALRSNDYDGAVGTLVTQVGRVITADAGVTLQQPMSQRGPPAQERAVGIPFGRLIFFGIVFLVFIVFASRARGGGLLGFLLGMFFGGGGRGGWGGGGFGGGGFGGGGGGDSGGGFGGFGGGSSGGGGASGSW